MARPIAILGGTFDPVHNAHLAIARAALEALRADRVLWLPTGAPPYRGAPVAPASHRLAMLKLALQGEARFALDERELAPGASGYTYDSLVALQKDFPGRPLVLLMGADQYAKRATWHRWAEIERLCEIAVFARPGWKDSATAKAIPFAPQPISASDIRARVARSEDVSAMLPAAVLGYIRAHRLYR
ncbi:MAG: nicotinate (nicotinamide) nucleotide adenylyltransferase [Betaproteobacteria bacterium]|nr:nicotinate (nicotinamide) nucleotide adenylyltransferase [Betaproteobacteria bacterium]